MKQWKKYWLMMLSLIFFWLGTGQVVFADELNFTVETKPGENQIDKTKTYYDLRVEPGQTEELNFILKNTSDKKITVLIRANTAMTNDNGVIDYGISDVKKYDASLKYPFADLTKVDQEVSLEPKQSKELAAVVKIPTEPFKGILLGGLYFTQKDDQDDQDDQSGVQIINKFGYAVGVRLSESEDLIEPDMKLLDVKAGQRNYRNVILANLQNPTPRIIGNIEVSADVYAINNKEKPLYHSSQENMNMAPNTNFNYAITMNNKPFKSGKYLLKMVVRSGEHEWRFEKEFEIKADEAKKFNEEAVELAEEPKDNKLWIILGIIFVLLIIIIILWIIHSKRKHEQELAKAKGNKSKSHSKTKTVEKSTHRKKEKINKIE